MAVENRNIYALLIGVGDYQKLNILNLPTYSMDLMLIQSALTSGLKIPKEQIRLLAGEENKGCVTRKDMARALAGFKDLLKEDSSFILYFSGHGRDRNLTFSGQTPEQMTRGILDAMSDGSNFLFGVPQMPDILNDLLLYDPLTSEGENGGRQVTLIFRENTEQLLEGTGVDMACLLAAITYSLTTYIPGVPEVCVRSITLSST